MTKDKLYHANNLSSKSLQIISLNLRNEYKSYLSLIRNIDAANTHRLIATRQTAAYRKNINELAEDSILIDIDWKQKVLIGNN